MTSMSRSKHLESRKSYDIDVITDDARDVKHLLSRAQQFGTRRAMYICMTTQTSTETEMKITAKIKTAKYPSPEYWDNKDLRYCLPALGSYGCPSNPRGAQIDPSIKAAWLRQLALDLAGR